MTSEEAEGYAASAAVEALGDAWGEPLWRFPVPNGLIDVHGATEEDARAALATVLVEAYDG